MSKWSDTREYFVEFGLCNGCRDVDMSKLNKTILEALDIAERLEKADICSTFKHNCRLYEMGHTPDYVSGFGEGYWQAIEDIMGDSK